MNKIIIVFILLNGFFGFSQSPKYKDKNAPVEIRIKDLLSKMTLEEKVSQMRMFHANLGIDLDEKGVVKLSENVMNRLKNGIGGIKNPGEFLVPEKAALLNNQLQEYIIKNNRLGIPALFVTESYNGIDAKGTTHFSRPINHAATWNRELVYQIWDVMGREARIRGLHMTHSPEADLARDPRFGRMSETFGEDTYLTTEMVVNAVKGVQGDTKGLIKTHIGAVTKHFAAYAQIAGGRNFASIEISPRTLADEILPPFQAAVQKANTMGIMASHGDINGVASHANYDLLTGILRKKWNFKGYLISDSQDIGRLNFFMHVAETPEDAAIMALRAGMDVDLYSDVAYALLPKLVKTHPDLVKNIDEATTRILRVKFTLGLFDNPFTDTKEASIITKTEKSVLLAKQSDIESTILLKNTIVNNNSILPLKINSYSKIALVGPAIKEGAKEAFAKVAGNSILFTEEKGFDLTDNNIGVPKLNTNTEEGFQKILSTVQNSDLCILFLGGDEFTSKEGFYNNALGDRASIDPVGRQDELLQKIKALNKPVIVVVKHRRTLSINEIAKSADAILDTWDLSEYGNESIAQMIFGQANPSGKLPVTVPRTIGQFPFHYSQKEINYKKGYLFMENGPLYPFGFGLSYTNFSYSNLHLSHDVISPKSDIKVTVDVKNTGLFTGKEVVQLYIKDIIGSVVRPDKELKEFYKIELQAGETKTVSFTIKPEMLEFTTLNMKRELEAGDYEVMVGTSSQVGLKENFKLVLK